MGRQFATREEIVQLFKELDLKSQRLARIIFHKHGSRLAARFIVKAHKMQCEQIVTTRKRNGFFEWMRGIYRKTRSFFVSGDPEGDSRITMMRMVII